MMMNEEKYSVELAKETIEKINRILEQHVEGDKSFKRIEARTTTVDNPEYLNIELDIIFYHNSNLLEE